MEDQKKHVEQEKICPNPVCGAVNKATFSNVFGVDISSGTNTLSQILLNP